MPSAIEAMKGQKYFSLETFKMDGTGVKTPLWFVELDGRFFFNTVGTSYKVKRLGRNPKARIAVCDMRGGIKGPWFDATARLIDDAAVKQKAYAALGKKYGFMFSLMTLGARLTGAVNKRALIEVIPAA